MNQGRNGNVSWNWHGSSKFAIKECTLIGTNLKVRYELVLLSTDSVSVSRAVKSNGKSIGFSVRAGIDGMATVQVSPPDVIIIVLDIRGKSGTEQVTVHINCQPERSAVHR